MGWRGFDKVWSITLEVATFIVAILGGVLPTSDDQDIADCAIGSLLADGSSKSAKQAEEALAEIRARVRTKHELVVTILRDRSLQL